MLFGKRREKEKPEEKAPEKPSTAENPRGGVATTTATLRDVLAVTHAVPVDKVRPLLPEGLAPDLLPAFDGEPMAFVQTVCAYYEDARWSLLPGGVGAASYHQITYRILTRREGRRSVFLVRTFVSNSELSFSRRALEKTVDHARLTVYVDGDPARATYKRYNVRAAGDTGKTEMEVTVHSTPPAPPIPFRSPEELTTFLLQRDETYFRAGAMRSRISLAPARLGPLVPVYGELTSARLTPWADLGLIQPEDMTRAFAVHLLASLTVVASPPRLVRLTEPEPKRSEPKPPTA